MTLEQVQKVLEELSTVGRFLIALVGIFVTLKPFLQNLDKFLPRSVIRLLTNFFQKLGLVDLVYYIKRKEYYEKRSKELDESKLATTSHASQICIKSFVTPTDPSAWVSGLKNTGNSCFMNSVLQALSSLPYLHQHLQDLNNFASETSLPVTRSLFITLRRLLKPVDRQIYLYFFYRRSYFNPTEIVTALSSNRRIISREQQDAEEFFQLISGALDTEGEKVARNFLPGLKSLINEDQQKKEYANPFTGLLANRLSCLKCGYTGAIRHFAFNNIQLILPNKNSTTLEECLSNFTSIEYLDDVSCRLCSFNATLIQLQQDIKQSKKKKSKLQTKKKMMEIALKTNQIEDEAIECIRTSSKSSKQVMLAKPPKILCLHVSRSAYLNTGMIYKNPCHLSFPEILNLAPYTTGEDLNTTNPRLPISTGQKSRVLYELMSVVVHYGNHSSGHFVAYKRCIYSENCACLSCKDTEEYVPQESWYRISDTKVEKCHLDEVLLSNPYMLFYETVDDTNESNSVLDSVDTKINDRDNTSQEISTDIYDPIDEASKEALFIANALMAKDIK